MVPGSLGGAIENVLDSSFNSDWLWLYNSFQFDSGVSFLFSTVFITILFGVSTGVLYLVYKENKNLEE